MKEGPFKIWYGDGSKSKETIYKNGKKNGLTREWYKNGRLKIETNFKNGKKMAFILNGIIMVKK